MSRDAWTRDAVASLVKIATEPVMAFCPVCERAVEAENMEDVLVLGSDGETERACWDCADSRRGR